MRARVEKVDVIVPLNTRTIVSHVNKKYGVPGDEKLRKKLWKKMKLE